MTPFFLICKIDEKYFHRYIAQELPKGFVNLGDPCQTLKHFLKYCSIAKPSTFDTRMRKNNVRFNEKMEVTGKSGLSHRFDIVISPSLNESYPEWFIQRRAVF